MAERFTLSQRQLQADLNVIRVDLGLPLRREHGYRFADASGSTSALTVADLHTLCQLVQRGSRDPSISAGALEGLGARLAESFPPPLRPLARETLVAGARDETTPLPTLLMVLAGAFARSQAVRLSLALPVANGLPNEPLVQPEVLLPYGGSWYLIGHCQHPNRDLIVCLDEIASVTVPT